MTKYSPSCTASINYTRVYIISRCCAFSQETFLCRPLIGPLLSTLCFAKNIHLINLTPQPPPSSSGNPHHPCLSSVLSRSASALVSRAFDPVCLPCHLLLPDDNPHRLRRPTHFLPSIIIIIEMWRLWINFQFSDYLPRVLGTSGFRLCLIEIASFAHSPLLSHCSSNPHIQY